MNIYTKKFISILVKLTVVVLFPTVLLTRHLSRYHPTKLYRSYFTGEKYDSLPNPLLKVCIPLNDKITKISNTFTNNLSLTVTNHTGDRIIDINGSYPRIPASNIKLLTTLYYLDNIGYDVALNTSLYFTDDNVYVVEGEGDPDLNIRKIRRIVTRIFRV